MGSKRTTLDPASRTRPRATRCVAPTVSHVQARPRMGTKRTKGKPANRALVGVARCVEPKVAKAHARPAMGSKRTIRDPSSHTRPCAARCVAPTAATLQACPRMGKKRTKGKAGCKPWTAAEWAVFLRAAGYFTWTSGGGVGLALVGVSYVIRAILGT